MKPLRLPLITPLLRWFLLAMVLANIASMMVFSLLAVYLAELGASVAEIGLVFSVASLVPLVLQIVGGWLSDTLGRLRTVAIGSAAATVGYIGFVLAPDWQWMLVALCLEYISGSLVSPSFGAFIAEQSDESNRGRVFGLSQSIFMIVGVVGPLLGGFLAGRFGFKVMLVSAAALYTFASLLRIWMAWRVPLPGLASSGPLTLHGLRSNVASMAGLLASGGLLTWILLTDGVRDIAFRLSDELQPLYFSEIGGLTVEQIGWMRSIVGLAIMLTMLPAGWFADKRSERAAIASGFILQSVGILIFLQAHSLLVFTLSVVVFGVGVGLMAPAYNALISKAVPENQRGVAFGLFSTSLGILSLPAPWAGGQLWERFNPRLPFYITAVAGVLAVIPVWFKFSLPKDANAPPAAPPGRNLHP